MINRLLASIAVLLVGTALARGQSCAADCCDIPTSPIPPIRLIQKEPVPPPHETPPGKMANITIFLAAVAPPKYTAGPPQPPLKYFRCPPPVVTTFLCPPPKVELFRLEPTPPPPPTVCAQPPIELFRLFPEPPREAP